MLAILRKRRGILLYLASSSALMIFCLLHSASKNTRVNQLKRVYPWQMVDYDEYNCGCPRSGPPIIVSSSQSICSDWSTSRGAGQRVVSYSIYGDMNHKGVYRQYYSAIEERLKDVQKYYEGWVVRLYHNKSQSDGQAQSLLCRLYCLYPHFDPCHVHRLYPTEDTLPTNPRPSLSVSSGISEAINNYFKDAGKYPKDTVEGVWEEGGDAANATAERSTTRGGGVKSSPGGDEEENLGLTGEKAITNRENMRNRREYGRISSKDVGGEKAMTSTNPTTTTPEEIHPGLTGARSYEQLLIGKMWRFLVMADPLVAEFLVRDVDSAILPREVAAVRYWLSNSTAILHLMRDHPSHNGLILAGMWGGSRVRGGDKFRNMIREMLRWPPRNFWDYDQMMLKRVVWPEVLDSLLAHDSYFCGNPHFRSHHRSAPFPTRRDRRYFVGWGPTRDHELSGVTVCPKECRPPDHQDWSYC